MIGALLIISIIAFIVIQLPPGDFLTVYVRLLERMGVSTRRSDLEDLEQFYGLDKPLHIQYLKWMGNFVRGDLGRSFSYQRSLAELLAERVPYTMLLSLIALLLTYIIAIPIAIYSSTHQYSLGDYIFTVIGFIGLAVPGFLLALILMFLFNQWFGMSIGGLFSFEYLTASWSIGKIIDLLKHLLLPIVIVGLSGTASIIRIMRSCLLDELSKQYVITARSKGVSERKLLWKYPVRIALNPIVSTIGWILPSLVSGSIIVSVVLNLPTTGPLLLEALRLQDMYLAGSTVMILSFLTILGTFISDLILGALDPRIRMEGKIAR